MTEEIYRWFKCQDCGATEAGFTSTVEMVAYVKHHRERLGCKNQDIGEDYK